MKERTVTDTPDTPDVEPEEPVVPVEGEDTGGDEDSGNTET